MVIKCVDAGHNELIGAELTSHFKQLKNKQEYETTVFRHWTNGIPELKGKVTNKVSLSLVLRETFQVAAGEGET